jgi:hypothetical protein
MTSDEPAGLFYAALQHTRRSKKKHFRKHQDSMAGLTLLGEILHEEHFRILVWMCDLQNLLASDAGQRCPNACNHQERQELHALIRSLDEVLAHHVFDSSAPEVKAIWLVSLPESTPRSSRSPSVFG